MHERLARLCPRSFETHDHILTTNDNVILSSIKYSRLLRKNSSLPIYFISILKIVKHISLFDWFIRVLKPVRRKDTSTRKGNILFVCFFLI